MFAKFDENPAMTLRVIKETKRYGRTHGQTHTRTDNVKTVYPLQTKFAGGIKKAFENFVCLSHLLHIFATFINLCNYRGKQRRHYLSKKLLKHFSR